MKKIKGFVDTGVLTTNPSSFNLVIRETGNEVGLLALDPKGIEQMKIEGVAIWVYKNQVPKLIKKLKEVV